jgi:hypothetical protein
MGLGDIFRRREPAPARPTPANPTAGGGPSIAYLFAHMGLPGAAFANPAGFLASMAHPDAEQQRRLKGFWERLCRHQSDTSTPTPESFGVHQFGLCGWKGVAVEMPEPQRPTEAHLVAFLAKLPEDDMPSLLKLPAHYFTLEKEGDLMSQLARLNGIEEPYESRVIEALRGNPQLLLTLLREAPFRATLERDLSEQLIPALRTAALLDGSLKAHFDSSPNPQPNYESLVADASAFNAFLDEYAKLLKPTHTILGGWTANRTHVNCGPGSRVDRDAFLSDIAVLLLQQGQ